jgi:DNA repair protein RadC
MIHNHPSGDPAPSRADIEVTRKVAEAGKRLGIAVHDHIIIGASGHSSLRAMGLL